MEHPLRHSRVGELQACSDGLGGNRRKPNPNLLQKKKKEKKKIKSPSMAPSSAIPDSSSLRQAEQSSDKDLQQFFVLHKALPRKSERKESKPGKTRRKIDLSQSSPKTREQSDVLSPEEDADQFYEQLRLQAFDASWSEVEWAIEGSLRQINLNTFEDVRKWVLDSFAEIKSTGSLSISKTLCPYPLVTDGICRQIFAALIMTQNIESVDDLSTFQELCTHLRSSGYHVAKLSSVDFTAKHGIAGCLRSLLRQLVMVALDSYDMSVLASWYSEPENYDKPVVVIIDDMEQCSGSVLTEFISMLSEWIIKIPIILVLGVATAVDALRKLLPSDALRHLNFFRFTLASPSERLNAILGAILARPCLGFTIGHEVAIFLRNYFSRHDGTITSLIRALKIACTKHFSMEPLSFLGHFMHREEMENAWIQMCEALPVMKLMYAFDLPSCRREKFSGRTSLNLVQGLHDFRRLWKGWNSELLCLFEIGKLSKMQLLDIFCEAVDPSPTPNDALALSNLPPSLVNDQKLCHARSSHFAKGRLIGQAIQKVRDLLKPIECAPFHEIFCFKHVGMLQSALIGDPRRIMHLDLLKSPSRIQCCCCHAGEDALTSSVHDTSIMYHLAQEHGDFINLHDWYQSFKMIIMETGWKGKKSSASRKADIASCCPDVSEASIQARFCRAVTELQITGLIRMPSKRRPEYVQRVVMGL